MTSRNEARIASNVRQIAALRIRRDEIVSECLTAGISSEKCQERCEAIGEQISELYAEIDAIEAEESKVEHGYATHSDEFTVEQLLSVRHLGWTANEIIAQQKKAARR